LLLIGDICLGGGGDGNGRGTGIIGRTNSQNSDKVILASPSVSILLTIARSSSSLA